jgi:hypothetical protein
LDPAQTNFLAHSLTDHPYLTKVGFKVLNITAEATDSQGRVFRYQDVSRNLSSDPFIIVTGFGVKYVGLDPYGTEFAGLPPNGTLTVKFWISGYLQAFSETVTVTAPGKTIPVLCTGKSDSNTNPNPVVMESGAVISGTLELRNLVDVETPHQGEISLEVGSATDRLFGGNVLIQAFDHSGLLRGVVVLNGTRADSKTTYANSTIVRFYVIGFSEFYNRTWAERGRKGTTGYPAIRKAISSQSSLGVTSSQQPLLSRFRRGVIVQLPSKW